MDQKRFLITGGSQGIGAALVTLARKAGHRVVFTGRHDDTIGQVVGETGAFGLRADSSIGDDNEKTVEVCTQQMGGIDVFVNNAASWYDAAAQATATSLLPFDAVSSGWIKGYGMTPSLVYSVTYRNTLKSLIP